MIHIVDDDRYVRESTRFLLHGRGFVTETYSSGVAFLQTSSLKGTCVILDLRMPGMSGLEVQAMLLELQVELPVILISGHGDREVADQAMRLGAVAYLEKPYEERDLLAAIEMAKSPPYVLTEERLVELELAGA